MKAKRAWITAGAVLLAVFLAAVSAAKERSEIPDKYKWDLTVMFKTAADFKAAEKAFLPDAEKLAEYKGKLGESAATLRKGLDLYYSLENRLRRMEAYTFQLHDQDTRISENKAFKSEVETIRSKFGEISSFIEPEISAVDSKKIEAYVGSDPGLSVYKFPLSETIRRKAHILSSKEERIMAAAADVAGAEGAYTLLTNADLPFETITLSDGTTAKMDYPTYSKLRASPVEADRVLVFKTFFGQYSRFKRTLGELLYNQMKWHNFKANMRGYPNTLDAALDYNGIDPKIYTSLIEAAHRNFATLHRYCRLKARALGKEKLDYTDLYMPFTKETDITMTYEKAEEVLLSAFGPLGPEYVNTVKEAFHSGWIDVYPNEGKDPGGYMNGWAYEVHPYILVNYTDTYDEVQTLAHELGHSMHSYNSNKTQPFPTADYSTFVAEVASTFNENLLGDHMLKKVKSDDEKLYLLGEFLDASIKGTFFRQVLFAEFELSIHQMAEKGEALTDEAANKLYLGLVKEYYGADQGVVNVPDFVAVEWSVVPHFYYNYYVYQYSTSIAAASLLSQKVLAKETGALDRYMKLLRSGGSDNPVKLLQNAGADMTNPDAYLALMQRANRYMDEMEKIMKKKAGK